MNERAWQLFSTDSNGHMPVLICTYTLSSADTGRANLSLGSHAVMRHDEREHLRTDGHARQDPLNCSVPGEAQKQSSPLILDSGSLIPLKWSRTLWGLPRKDQSPRPHTLLPPVSCP